MLIRDLVRHGKAPAQTQHQIIRSFADQAQQHQIIRSSPAQLVSSTRTPCPLQLGSDPARIRHQDHINHCTMLLVDLNCTPPEEESSTPEGGHVDHPEEDNMDHPGDNMDHHVYQDAGGHVDQDSDINMEEEGVDPDQNDDFNMEEEDVDPDQDAGGVQPQKKTRKTLSDTKKYAAYVAMHALCMSNGGKVRKTDKKNVADFFEQDIQVIQRIWRRAMKQIEEGLPVDVSSRRFS